MIVNFLKNIFSKKKQTFIFFAHVPYNEISDGINLMVFSSNNFSDLELIRKTDIMERDASLLKRYDTYYILYTDYFNREDSDFTILKTKDWVTFESNKYNVGLFGKLVGGNGSPDWYIRHDGGIGISITGNLFGAEKMIDRDNNVLDSSTVFTVEVNLDNMSFSNLKHHTEFDSLNHIDSHIFTISENYYGMLIKDDMTKCYELWTSENQDSWQKKYERIPNTPSYIEGGFVLKDGDTFYLYYDQYAPEQMNGISYKRGYYYLKTKDWEKFSKPNLVKTDAKDRIRHGSGIIEIPTDEKSSISVGTYTNYKIDKNQS